MSFNALKIKISFKVYVFFYIQLNKNITCAITMSKNKTLKIKIIIIIIIITILLAILPRGGSSPTNADTNADIALIRELGKRGLGESISTSNCRYLNVYMCFTY